MKKSKLIFALLTTFAAGAVSANGGDHVVCLVDTDEHGTWDTHTHDSEDTSNVLALCRSQGGIPYIDRRNPAIH